MAEPLLERRRNACHPSADAGDQQAEQGQTEWLGRGLEVQEEENPIHERHEQTPEEPPETAVIGHSQKSDLPVKAGNQAGTQKRVTKS